MRTSAQQVVERLARPFRRGRAALSARTWPTAPGSRRRGSVLLAVLALLLGGLGAATAAQLLGAGTATRDAASLSAAAADRRPAAVVRGLSAGAPPGSLTFTDVPVAADVPAPATDVVVSGLAANGIPNVALNAYRVAAARIDSAMPSCGIDWSLLAGIGRVESNHGRFGGATLGADGSSTPQIIGPALDGVHFAYIADTDHGVWDHDTRYDRAVGPMQFIPSTWRAYAIDADGNGTTDPLNINDAALGAAHYLCVAGGDLSTEAGQRRAVLAYNHSDSYVAQVLALAHAYAAGIPVADLPLVGITSGDVPPPGPYGTPSAAAAPGPALGEADNTTSADAVGVAQPAADPTPAAQQDSGGPAQQQSGTGTSDRGSTRADSPATTAPTPKSTAPAAPTQQSGTEVPAQLPTTSSSLPSVTVPTTVLPTTAPAGPTVVRTLADGTKVLSDGTICVLNPLTHLMPSQYCPTG